MTTTTRNKKPQSEKTDAISLLTADHKKVKKMFSDYEKLKESGSDEEKEELVLAICTELSMHAEAEEAIFYPAARAAIDDDDLLDEAEVEHDSAKDLMAQLQSLEPSDALYDAKVKVLGEYVNHHVEEEQNEMFVKAKKAKLDLEELGSQILVFKENWEAQPPAPEGREPERTRGSGMGAPR
ncbi:hemerythrin domain-containing protein [soil metagenome]